MILFCNVKSVAMERLRLEEKKGKERKIDEGSAFPAFRLASRKYACYHYTSKDV